MAILFCSNSSPERNHKTVLGFAETDDPTVNPYQRSSRFSYEVERGRFTDVGVDFFALLKGL
jgi:hypothetical protein